MFMRTIAATVVSIVTFSIVAFVVGTCVFAIERLLTTTRAELIQFFPNVIGAVVGIHAARVACDTVFRDYSGRAIAIVCVILSTAGAGAQAALVPFHWPQIAAYAQYLTIAIAAVANFWNRNLEIADGRRRKAG